MLLCIEQGSLAQKKKYMKDLDVSYAPFINKIPKEYQQLGFLSESAGIHKKILQVCAHLSHIKLTPVIAV